MIRRVISCLALLVTIASATGYSVRAWQSEDGLPGNVLRSVVQSSDGFLWVASPEGIARFDGIEFETLAMPPGVPLPRSGPNRLFATPGNVVWFSGHRGSLLRIENKVITRIFDDENLTTPWNVSQVVAMKSGEIVARRGTETWLVSSLPPRRLETPDNQVVTALELDLRERARSGRIMPDGYAEMLIDESGYVWRNDPSDTLIVTDADGKPMMIDFDAIDTEIGASEFIEDKDHNIWVASRVSGLIRFRKLRATVIDESAGLTERAAVSVLEDSSGALWVGNRTSGVDRMVDGVVHHHELSPETSGLRRSVSALYQDRERRLWAAARDGSIFRWNGADFDLAFPRQPDLTKIDTIYQDEGGTLWFGGVHRLFEVNGSDIVRLGVADGVPDCHVTVISGDGSGTPWFGTMDGRVFLRRDGKFLSLGSDGDLNGKKVSGLIAENSDLAWVTTLGDGLHFWDGGRWHRFGRDQGLPDLRLTCILDDGKGYFWLGSLGGIFRISRAELLASIRSPESPLHWLRIDRADGLPTRECIGSSLPAGWATAGGRLLFPTARGLVAIDLSQIKINAAPPPVFLREITSNGHTLLPRDGRYATGPGRTRLEFDYHGLAFSAPEKITYRTRLAGLDDSWRETGNMRVSTYEAVPPGKYTFEVLAINGDGTRSSLPARAEIVVTPHFWETRWFITTSILTLIAVATGAGAIISRIRMRHRIRDLKMKQSIEAERARISRDLHDDLGASLTELSILSALASENPADDTLRPALTSFSNKTKAVVGALDEIVWAATPSEDSLRSLVEYISAFAREFLETANITLRTDIIRQVPDIPIGPNRRHNVFLATRESLNNAVKHSRAREILLRISIEDGQLVILVQDDGQGFILEYAISGDGLGNLRKRMTDCGGNCAIESYQGGGTTITLTLPLPSPAPSQH